MTEFSSFRIFSLVLLVSLVSCAFIPVVVGEAPVYGVDYNPRREWSSCPNIENVLEDLRLLSSWTRRIRTYSFGDCNMADLVLTAVNLLKRHENIEFSVILGMWTTKEDRLLDAEFRGVQDVFQKHNVDSVEAIVVGSETVYRGEQDVATITRNIKKVRDYLSSKGIQHIKLAYADVFTVFLDLSELVDAVDFIMMNKFPFWEDVPIEKSMENLFSGMYSVAAKYPHKQVWISETGWPDAGKFGGAALATPSNAADYFKNFVCRANAENWNYLYFAAFDDDWKQPWQLGDTDIEKHWGIFFGNRTLKPHMVLRDVSTCIRRVENMVHNILYSETA